MAQNCINNYYRCRLSFKAFRTSYKAFWMEYKSPLIPPLLVLWPTTSLLSLTIKRINIFLLHSMKRELIYLGWYHMKTSKTLITFCIVYNTIRSVTKSNAQKIRVARKNTKPIEHATLIFILQNHPHMAAFISLSFTRTFIRSHSICVPFRFTTLQRSFHFTSFVARSFSFISCSHFAIQNKKIF